VSLEHLKGKTHEELRVWCRERHLEADSIRYDNPYQPELYTTLIVAWGGEVYQWSEVCKRCAAVVENRDQHNYWHATLDNLRTWVKL